MINPLFLLMRWLQLVPLALLLFAPFQDDVLRCNRRRGYLIALTYVLLSSIGMAALSPLTSLDGQRNIIARDAALVAAAAVLFYGWARAVRTSAVQKLLVGILLLHYDLALQAISNVFAALILGSRYSAEVNAEAGSLTYDLCLLAANLITWPLVWYFLHHILRKNLPALDGPEAKRGLGYLCAVALLFTIAIYDPRFEIIPEVPLFVAVLIVTDMTTYYIYFQEAGAVRQQMETARQLAEYQVQYQRIVSRMEGVRRLRHDVRHHLNTLGALNAQGKTEEIAAYLKQYGRAYERLEQHKFCGDPAVDSVLGYYLAQAGEENIPMDCQVGLLGSSGVAQMDMTVLLGNCLENAMEALRRLPAGTQRLDVTLKPEGPVLVLQVVNTCEAEADTGEFTSWRSFPSSKGRGRTGVGLRSITEIAEKYGGSAQFQRQGGEFTARVTLRPAAQNGTGPVSAPIR